MCNRTHKSDVLTVRNSQKAPCDFMSLPVEGGLGQAVHPGLQLQLGKFPERWDDEREDQGQAHKHGRQDHLGGRGQNVKSEEILTKSVASVDLVQREEKRGECCG